MAIALDFDPMPRKPLIRSNIHPYHVTARCNNREIFPISMDQTWECFQEYLFEMTVLYKTTIHAFVLMPNHFHLLISTPEADVGTIMARFMCLLTKKMNLISGRSGRIFSSRYHWCLVHSPIYYSHAIKYVYRNPVRANLIEKAEDYRYSTLCAALGATPSYFPFDHYPKCFESRTPKDLNNFLAWINTPTTTKNQDAIRKALRRLQFKLPKTQVYRKVSALESELS